MVLRISRQKIKYLLDPFSQMTEATSHQPQLAWPVMEKDYDSAVKD
jgi:hypothetical protein